MSDRNTDFARLWLRKADHDLITANQTLLLADGPTDTVCFHAQQAAEKALKAVLTLRGRNVPRFHDLVRLLELAVVDVPALEYFRVSCAEMTGYTVEVRYPGDEFDPERSEAVDAVRVAEELVALVSKEFED